MSDKVTGVAVIGEWKVSTLVKDWRQGDRTYVEIKHDSGKHLTVQLDSRISREIMENEIPNLNGFQVPLDVLEAARSALVALGVMLK